MIIAGRPAFFVSINSGSQSSDNGSSWSGVRSLRVLDIMLIAEDVTFDMRGRGSNEAYASLCSQSFRCISRPTNSPTDSN